MFCFQYTNTHQSIYEQFLEYKGIRTTDSCCLRGQAVSGGGENVLGRGRGV